MDARWQKTTGLYEEVFELAGAAADVVVCLAGEPGAAGGEIGFGAGLAGLSGAAGARGGQGIGFPAGEEGLEAGGGAADAGPGEQEDGRAGGITVYVRGERGAHPGQDRGEEGSYCFHS